MAATSQWFGQAATGLIARMWTPTQMGVILMVPSFVPNIDTQLRYSDVQASELATGGGYNPDVQWGPGATFTTRYGVIYEMTTADKWLWAILDFGGPIDVANGVFQIDWTAGLLSIATGPPV